MNIVQNYKNNDSDQTNNNNNGQNNKNIKNNKRMFIGRIAAAINILTLALLSIYWQTQTVTKYNHHKIHGNDKESIAMSISDYQTTTYNNTLKTNNHKSFNANNNSDNLESIRRPINMTHSSLVLKEKTTFKTYDNASFVMPPPNNKQGTLYICAGPIISFSKYVFPDFFDSENIKYYTRNAKTTKNDLMVFLMHPPCNKINLGFQELQRTFQGKVLVINGEPRGSIFHSGIIRKNVHDINPTRTHNIHEFCNVSQLYQIGSLPDYEKYYQQSISLHSSKKEQEQYYYYAQHSIRIFHCAIFLVKHIQPNLWPRILDPSAKIITPPDQLRPAVIYTTSKNVPHRHAAAKAIGEFLPIHFGGKGNVQTRHPGSQNVPEFQDFHVNRSPKHENHILYGKYKYCLVMENTYMLGYITEKIILAFLGGCLPIYYGTIEVFEIFNANAFVFYNVSNPTIALQQLQYLEQNVSAYVEMQNEPILVNGDQTVEDYFSLSDQIGNGTLKKRIRARLGLFS